MKPAKLFQIAVLALLLFNFSDAKAQLCGGWDVRVAVVNAENELIAKAALELINVPSRDDARSIKFQSATNENYNLAGRFHEGGEYSSKYEARISAPGYEKKIVSLPVEYCRTSLKANKYILERSRVRAEGKFKNNSVGKILADAYAKGEFSGVVLAAKGDRILFKGAVGEANREWKIPNSFTTKFRVCSVTKQFTAMLVMQLVEAGKINLDAPLADYLPDFRQDTAGKIKIRSLLLSASGLPVFPDEFYVNEYVKTADANFAINKYLQGDLLFEPGEKFNYNNGDFVILGAIVERVSGKSYEQNLREKIFQPLGMKNSGLLKNETVVENLARGYSFRDGKFINESFVQIENFGAAGAMYSTAEDLLLWDRALVSNKLLSKKFTDEMFTPSEKLGFVALGSWRYKLNLGGVSKTIVERQGYINGFCALNLIFPEENIAVIFLSNAETQTLFQTYASRGLSFEVLNTLFGK